MAALSDYLENALLNGTLRNIAYTPVATVYLALFTSPTTDAGGGTEVTGGSYSRQPVTFSAPSGGTCANSVDVVFTTATASWGTVTHCAVIDNNVGGNFLFHGPLASSKTVGSGDQFKVLATNLVCGLD
jgi:hypothetical protein